MNHCFFLQIKTVQECQGRVKQNDPDRGFSFSAPLWDSISEVLFALIFHLQTCNQIWTTDDDCGQRTGIKGHSYVIHMSVTAPLSQFSTEWSMSCIKNRFSDSSNTSHTFVLVLWMCLLQVWSCRLWRTASQWQESGLLWTLETVELVAGVCFNRSFLFCLGINAGDSITVRSAVIYYNLSLYIVKVIVWQRKHSVWPYFSIRYQIRLWQPAGKPEFNQKALAHKPAYKYEPMQVCCSNGIEKPTLAVSKVQWCQMGWETIVCQKTSARVGGSKV